MLGGHDVFHLGRVVEDLDAAMSTIGANLAISWAPVQERTIAVLTAGGRHAMSRCASPTPSMVHPTSS